MRTLKEEGKLTLSDKRNRWLWHILQKSACFDTFDLSKEEWEYEFDFHTIFVCDKFALGKCYPSTLYIARKEEDLDDSCYEFGLSWLFSDDDYLAEMLDVSPDDPDYAELSTHTIKDYLEAAGYPITFRTWKTWEGEQVSEAMIR